MGFPILAILAILAAIPVVGITLDGRWMVHLASHQVLPVANGWTCTTLRMVHPKIEGRHVFVSVTGGDRYKYAKRGMAHGGKGYG